MPFSPQLTPVVVPGEGFTLRTVTPYDEPDLAAAFDDPDVRAWNPGPADAEGIAEFVNRRADWSLGEHASWVIADPADRLVGSVSLFKIDEPHANCEIGYWVAPWARRQGYAVRAVRLASRFAFTVIGLHRVQLFHAVENTASCAVATSAGFVWEGTLRESFRYADGDLHDEHLHARLARD